MYYQTLGCDGQFLSSVVSSCKYMAADFNPHKLSEVLHSQRKDQDAFPSVVAEATLDSLGRQSSNTIPSFGRVLAKLYIVAAGRAGCIESLSM